MDQGFRDKGDRELGIKRYRELWIYEFRDLGI